MIYIIVFPTICYYYQKNALLIRPWKWSNLQLIFIQSHPINHYSDISLDRAISNDQSTTITNYHKGCNESATGSGGTWDFDASKNGSFLFR